MTNRYEHLEIQNTIKYDWESNLLKKTVRSAYFSNTIIGNFILGIEKMLVECFTNVEIVKTRNKID